VTIEKAIQGSVIDGVDILGAQEGISSAAELAGSPHFDAVLRYAKDKYDFVLIDCAPVIPVSESALIARRADAVLLVVREGQTSRGAAQMAKKRLLGMDVRLLGSVLNCAGSHSGGYGYYYSYSHYSYPPTGSQS
jgi:Mrp family chromosome partitioning ATPase